MSAWLGTAARMCTACKQQMFPLPLHTAAPHPRPTSSALLGDSAKFLAASPYIRDLATLVIGYGMAINIVEVTWKSKLKAAFPDPNSYSAFMGNFSSATGVVTLLMMLAGRLILKKWGWGVAALITPITLLTTGNHRACSF